MEKTTTVVHLRRSKGEIVQDCDIYIRRAINMGGWRLPHSIWANPFKGKDVGGAEESWRLYEDYVRNKPELMERLEELEGNRLGCWCKPKMCHGDI